MKHNILLPILALFMHIAGSSARCLQNDTITHPTTRHIQTTDGTNYVYDYVPAQGANATVLLLHGFPATRRDWHHQVPALAAAGYGVLAPDLLGYGDSDRPTALSAYNTRRMSAHLAEMLDREGLETVVAAAHDWGTVVLSKSLFWHRERYAAAAFLSTGYVPVDTFFDVDGLNVASRSRLGYEQYGYWYFFNSYDAASMIEGGGGGSGSGRGGEGNRLESAHSLFYHADAAAWAEDFSNIGAARTWLEANRTAPRAGYRSAEDHDAWMAAFGRRGAFEASLRCYQSVMRGVNAADEAGVPDEEKVLGPGFPVLSIGGLRDLVARPEDLRAAMEGWVAGDGASWTARDVDTGHWVMLEDPEGVNGFLLEFLGSL